MTFTTNQKKTNLIHFAERQLNEIILPFWTNRMVDKKHDGFAGKIDHSGRLVKGHPKGIVLNARILWTFSAIYQLFKQPIYLDLADRAYQYLEDHFRDRVNDGYVWSLNPDKSIQNGKKQIYAQAFVIYAFTEYAAAAGNEKALETAFRLVRLIEEKSFDQEKNGYLEAFSRDWGDIEDLRLSHLDMNEKKTTNTHLHIIEAYTRLYDFQNEPGLKERLLNLLHIFSDIILQDDHNMGLFYDENWNLKSDDISFGHDIEASWLLYEAALSSGDRDVISRVNRLSVNIASAVLPAMNKEGGLIHEGNRHEKNISGELEWWAQAEAIVGFINCFEITGDETWLDRAHTLCQYIDKYFIDRANGEWYYRVDANGKPISSYEKAGPWKCPYHNTRMCLEILRRLG
ncbi:MAG: AGE family epimerase/isomerase [Bacteroidales bacterium]|nr:AGE family epimerase/isomerase [Bacteroidales bacterium]